MNSTIHHEVTTVEELVAHSKSSIGTVLVSFPYNDYRTSRGIKAHSPQRHLKLMTDKAGSFVRFSGRKWDITGVKALVQTKENGSTYRHLMVTSINAR